MNFIFTDDIPKSASPKQIVRIIPSGLRNKSDLLSSFAEIFDFPGYFGNNWDAFRDVLLHWDQYPDVHEIFIIHQDIPLEKDEDNLKIYLDILKEAVNQNGKRFSLKIVFPKSAESILRVVNKDHSD